MADEATAALVRDPVFTALTRPQMFAGVTYTFFVVNALVTMELFLVTKSIWVVPVALLLHGLGAAACLGEPRIFDLWVLRARRASRLPSHRAWRCNSYRP
ncbi:type VI secretion protein [alpha proteobacterium AAP81b]|nr:type VI secretion protein [alpha proteobacterium AAP81b]